MHEDILYSPFMRASYRVFQLWICLAWLRLNWRLTNASTRRQSLWNMPCVGDALFVASCVSCRLAAHVQCAAQAVQFVDRRYETQDTRHETLDRWQQCKKMKKKQKMRSDKKVQRTSLLARTLLLSFFTLLLIYWKLDETFGGENRSTRKTGRFKNLTWRDTAGYDLTLLSAVPCATIRALNWPQSRMHLWHSSLNYERQLKQIGNADWLWGKLVYVPTQLGRDEVTVWTVFGRILVHVAHDALFAEITLDAQLLDDLVDLQ